MELKVKQVTLPEAIEFNFAELKQEITERTEAYVGMVYTDDQIKSAKADVAMLRKFTKALSDERIRVKKEYLKPYDEFEAKVKELSGIVDKAIVNIDSQIKIFDQIKQDEKKANIEEMFKNMLFPEWMTVEQIWNPKWLNASTSMASIEAELLNQKNDIIRNCQTLATLPNYSHEAVLFYQKTLDVSGALAKVTELADIEAKKKKMLEEEAKKRETENAFIPVPEQSPVIEVERIQEEEAAPEPKMWVGFEAYLNKTQAALLKEFFNNNNIDFRPVRIKED